MNHFHHLTIPLTALFLGACASTRPPVSDPASLRAAVEAIAPAPTEQQPVLVVRVDAGVAADSAKVQTIVFHFPGASGKSGAQMAQPDKALAYKASRYLNHTQRFRVVSFNEMLEMKKLKEEGLIAPGGEAEWALNPDYMVTCTIIDLNSGEEESEDGMRIGLFKFGKSESFATVKVAVKVVALANGLVVWEGEAQGVQSSKASNTALNLGLFEKSTGKSTSPTLDAAMELCVMDLTQKLAQQVPLKSISEVVAKT